MVLETNKARYAARENVTIKAAEIPENASKLVLTAYHLDKQVGEAIWFSVGDSLVWEAPKEDFQGYLLELTAMDGQGAQLDFAQIGVDVSGTWRRFPRYGYMWDFTAPVEAKEKLRQMNRFHLNGLQYYDWQYRHHQPVSKDQSKWQDWSGREIDGKVLNEHLETAHKYGICNMAYNMIYAANGTYLTDQSGVKADWRLKKANGEDFSIIMGEEQGPTGVLQYFNPLNKNWQEYIFEKQNQVFEAFAFDGWHGDTIGENGRMTTSLGEPLGYDEKDRPIYLVMDCYTQFLNAAKTAIAPHELVFNPVGAQGIDNVSKSNVDVLYAEFWPWDKNTEGEPYVSYNTIHKEILRAAEVSRGKSLVVAGYVNYKNPAALFNPPAVLLMEAVCFASGGARIELGNGLNMLSNEYFPDDEKKRMSQSLLNAVTRMYDFIVAYENLLRDGQTPLECRVEMGNAAISHHGEVNKIWVFAKEDNVYSIIHFINLVGTDNEWRDTEQKKGEPKKQIELEAKVYISKAVESVCLASPDRKDLKPLALSFTKGRDENGPFVTFKISELHYWNMVFIKHNEKENYL